MLNLATAVDKANHDFLRRGADAVDVFCNKLNEIRDSFKKNYDKIERLMKMHKISKMPLVALCVETHLKKRYKTEQEQINTKKLKIAAEPFKLPFWKISDGSRP